jgi:anti-anti-sigma regulatory factor
MIAVRAVDDRDERQEAASIDARGIRPPAAYSIADREETTFIDSAVLKELLRARAELAAHDGRLVLAAVPPPVRRLLDLTRTSELFEHVADVSKALARACECE